MPSDFSRNSLVPPVSRRNFLARSTTGALGLLTASNLPANRLWADSPKPGAALIPHTKNPFNAEPPLEVLPDSFITPAKYLFVRNHGPIPQLDAATHTVRVEGMVETPGDFTRAELQDRFENIDCPATITCTGNRRSEFNWFKPPEGTPWNAGAIGTPTWQGARLSDILRAAGIKEGAKHVWFESLDQIPQDNGETISFGCSIPIEKVLADSDQIPGTILAWGMNGEPLPPAHGFPLRIVVPGYVGGRSVKWLKRIVVSDHPSSNKYWTHSYRLFTKKTPLALAESHPLYPFPVNVAICEPPANEDVKTGEVTVRGYALPSGRLEARIQRVQVSANNGHKWVKAKILDEPCPFCWVRWEAKVPVTDQTKQLIARAIDSTGDATPRRASWNVEGYLYNGWHHLPVK